MFRPSLAASKSAVSSPECVTRILTGDVKGAFRHLMVHHGSVAQMGARLRERLALVIDLSAPFGWTSSPTYYGAFGGAITWLLGRESPATLASHEVDTDPFFGYEWVDDHILVEPDKGNRLQLAAGALRLAMMAVLGPRAMNEKKFSQWETRIEVLGLIFDTRAMTVSMPSAKILKALGRIHELTTGHTITKTKLQQLLGSLRHVCICCRSATPFYQRVQALCNSTPRYGSSIVPEDVAVDLQWCRQLLQDGPFARSTARDVPLDAAA